MIKQINKLLKLVGLNLVRAKRRKAPKSEGQRVAEFLDEFLGETRPPYTREELESASLKCAVNQPGAVPLPDYTGDAEWQDTGKTHYVGDDCPGGHQNICIGPKAKVQVVDLDAAFVPVDIGADDHEMTRVEQPNSDNKISGPTS